MSRSLRDLFLQSARPIVIALGFAVLAVISLASLTLVVRANRDSGQVAHALGVANALTRLQLHLRDADGNQRDFLLTGEAEYFDGFRRSADAVMSAAQEVADAVASEPGQATAIAAIEPLLIKHIEAMRATIALYRGGERERAVAGVRAPERQAAAAEIGAAVAGMVGAEQRLVEARKASSRRTDRLLLVVDLVGAAIVLALSALSVVLVRRTDRERESQLRGLVRSNADLEAVVAARTTNLREAFVELQRSAEILHNTINSMADAVIVADPGGKVLISNPAARRMFGSLPDAKSPEWETNAERFHADGVTPMQPDEAPVHRVLRGEQVDDAAFVQRLPGVAEPIHVMASGRPMRDAQGALAGAVMVYHDVTALQETERRLQHALKMDAVGQLTGGISHDFNNCLTVILGTIEILAEGVADRPHLAIIARMIEEAAARGADLTRQLLAFARMQPLQPQATDVNELVSGAARLLRPTLGEHVEIETVLGTDVWPAMVDASQLTNSVVNLAINARDAMPEGGRLTIETRNVVRDRNDARRETDAVGDYVLITVSDNGVGIPEAIRDRIFEPFFTTKESGKGTGLGLAMVYGFVKQSNGHIEVDASAGQGATFRLYLPRARVSEVSQGDAEQDVIEGGNESILLVEDEQLVRDYATTQLTNMGYTVHVAANSAQALALLEGGVGCDLLLTDVVLPGAFNGRQLALEVTRRHPNVKVLYTSGYIDDATTPSGGTNAAPMLSKPYRRAELALLVRVALGSRGRAATARPAAVASETRRGSGTRG